jgi:hydrogenase maturation protease
LPTGEKENITEATVFPAVAENNPLISIYGWMMNLLIAAIGYQNLRDHSFGPVALARLAAMAWPAGVECEDLSYNPIAVMQKLEDARGRYDRAIFLSAVPRDRPPGALTVYRWQPPELRPELVQERIAEGITGIIGLDNLLIVCQHFGVLPPDVLCIEVEPLESGFGPQLSPLVAARVDEAIERIRVICRNIISTTEWMESA